MSNIELNKDVIIEIIHHINDLSTISRLLRTCSEYYSIYNNISKKKLGSDIENQLYGIDQLLRENPKLCYYLSIDDFTTILLQYAQNRNSSMFEYMKTSASPVNSVVMIMTTIFFCSKDTMSVYAGKVDHKHDYIKSFIDEYQSLEECRRTIIRIIVKVYGVEVAYHSMLLETSFLEQDVLLAFLEYGKIDINKNYGHNVNIIQKYISHTNNSSKEKLGIILDVISNRNLKLDLSIDYLHQACRTSNLEKVKLLIGAGLDVNYNIDKDGTPLHNAIYNSHNRSDIVHLLIENGANVNALKKSRDQKCGITPLYDAIINNYLYPAKILLENGANPYILCEKRIGVYQSSAELFVTKYCQYDNGYITPIQKNIRKLIEAYKIR